MKLASTIELYGGGPGSGCNPEAAEAAGTRCGRPSGGGKENIVAVRNKPWVRDLYNSDYQRPVTSWSYGAEHDPYHRDDLRTAFNGFVYQWTATDWDKAHMGAVVGPRYFREGAEHYLKTGEVIPEKGLFDEELAIARATSNARAFYTLLEAAPQTKQILYRGVEYADSTIYKKGTLFRDVARSFTEDEDVAKEFRGLHGDGPLLILEKGAKTVPIYHATARQFRYEREHVTSGIFRVKDVEKDANGRITKVYLKQERLLGVRELR